MRALADLLDEISAECVSVGQCGQCGACARVAARNRLCVRFSGGVRGVCVLCANSFRLRHRMSVCILCVCTCYLLGEWEFVC